VSHYASGFGEYSNTSNEEGIYAGIDLVPIKRLKINFYCDWFRFFSARYGATQPGQGTEILFQAGYQYKKWEHSFRFKHERRPEDLKGGGAVGRKKGEIRYQLNYQLDKRWEFRTRLSYSYYQKAQVNECGFLAFQDVIYSSRNSRLKMQYRLSWFHTDSYQSRIYAYENNVLYGYSFPSFMGQGFRTYLNLAWKLHARWTCYFKGGYVVYPDREVISSGVTQVDGNKLFDLTFQVRFTI
jgi:hypothetical protein